MGSVATPARTTTRRPRRSPEQRRQERVAEAAVFCADALGSTWRDAVADRAADYISDTTWRRLTRGNHRRQCRALAKIAGVVLRWKQEMHAAIGSAAGALMFRLAGSRAARAFVRELAANIPLPIDAKLTAVARCTQAVGVLLCVSRGDDLTRCQCFIDLALAETKTQVKKILLAAAASWTQMATYPTPTATTLVRDK
jgi:hypothetical protein